jgi:hypothetical protein
MASLMPGYRTAADHVVSALKVRVFCELIDLSSQFGVRMAFDAVYRRHTHSLLCLGKTRTLFLLVPFSSTISMTTTNTLRWTWSSKILRRRRSLRSRCDASPSCHVQSREVGEGGQDSANSRSPRLLNMGMGSCGRWTVGRVRSRR